jgi:glycosyltransferase involved in cell wall biosynthesis
MKRADLIVTPTHAMKCMIQDACPAIRDRPFYTLYHGFDRESFSEPLDVKFDQHLSGSKGVKLLYPTHPAPHKGFEVLFDMLVKLKSDRMDFRLFATISVDDWPQGVRAYERRVEHLGLQDNVVFMGRVPQQQMASVYKKCDLMIYPSLCESFGFSMLEAMGYELPIVAADTPVNREICKEAAQYYPPLDPIAGAKAIREALEPSVMQKLREGGRSRITSTDWTWGRYAREFAEMIGKIAP